MGIQVSSVIAAVKPLPSVRGAGTSVTPERNGERRKAHVHPTGPYQSAETPLSRMGAAHFLISLEMNCLK